MQSYFLDIRFDNKEMMKLYKDYRGEQYTRLRMLYEPDYAARNNELEKKYSYIDKVDEFILQSLTGSPTILDWGGNTGINTPLAKKRNHAYVYDISAKKTIDGVEKINRKNLNQIKFDLVVISNVLEHVSYPKKCYKR